MAEAARSMLDLTELQFIKIVDLRSAVTRLVQRSAGVALMLDTVVAIQPVVGKPTDLLVLTVPGGLYGVGSDPAFTTLYWELLTIGMVVLQVSESSLEGNGAAGAGGAISVLNSAVLQAEDNVIVGNSADKAGGGVALFESAVAYFSNCSLEANRASVGGALYLSDNVQANLSNSSVTRNIAADCGGGIGTASSLPVSLLGHVSFERNGAVRGGGAICVLPDQQQLCNNDANKFMVTVAGIDSFMTAIGNYAEGGGGVFYDACTPRERMIPIALNSSAGIQKSNQTLVNLRLDFSKWKFVGNSAGYGNLMATVARYTQIVVGSNLGLTYSPGQRSKLILDLTDG